MTIDINKKYRTRSDKNVRIYAVDGSKPYSVHGAMEEAKDSWCPRSWTAKGKFHRYSNNPNDLVEVKPRITQKGWVNVYPDHFKGAYETKEHADEMAAPHRIACVEIGIDCEEGEGL